MARESFYIVHDQTPARPRHGPADAAAKGDGLARDFSLERGED